MDDNSDPIAAVSSADPSSVYAAYTAVDSLVWNERHGMWIAANPRVAREVLDHPGCVVRPALEPVPASLAGSTAGFVFGKLVRMTDGEGHQQAKKAVNEAIAKLDDELVRSAARTASTLLPGVGRERFAYDLPIYTLGLLTGVPENHLSRFAELAGAFAGCLSPGASDEAMARGIDAAEQLWVWISSGSGADPVAGALPGVLKRAFTEAGVDDPDAAIANVMGFVFQAYDATAALIANTVVHLARHPDVLDISTASWLQVVEVVSHVARHDAPIQNTRRFVTEVTTIAGQPVRAGDEILVLLATSDDDQQIGPCPFGHGRYACPGQRLALTIASEAIVALGRRRMIPPKRPDVVSVRYRPSVNVRMPMIETMAGSATSEEAG